MKSFARQLEARAETFRFIRDQHEHAVGIAGLVEGSLARHLLGLGEKVSDTLKHKLELECSDLAYEIRKAAIKLEKLQLTHAAQVEQLARQKQVEETGRYTDSALRF